MPRTLQTGGACACCGKSGDGLPVWKSTRPLIRPDLPPLAPDLCHRCELAFESRNPEHARMLGYAGPAWRDLWASHHPGTEPPA